MQRSSDKSLVLTARAHCRRIFGLLPDSSSVMPTEEERLWPILQLVLRQLVIETVNYLFFLEGKKADSVMKWFKQVYENNVKRCAVKGDGYRNLRTFAYCNESSVCLTF